jgi:sentrin-specific protease 1
LIKYVTEVDGQDESEPQSKRSRPTTRDSQHQTSLILKRFVEKAKQGYGRVKELWKGATEIVFQTPPRPPQSSQSLAYPQMPGAFPNDTHHPSSMEEAEEEGPRPFVHISQEEAYQTKKIQQDFASLKVVNPRPLIQPYKPNGNYPIIPKSNYHRIQSPAQKERSEKLAQALKQPVWRRVKSIPVVAKPPQPDETTKNIMREYLQASTEARQDMMGLLQYPECKASLAQRMYIAASHAESYVIPPPRDEGPDAAAFDKFGIKRSKHFQAKMDSQWVASAENKIIREALRIFARIERNKLDWRDLIPDVDKARLFQHKEPIVAPITPPAEPPAPFFRAPSDAEFANVPSHATLVVNKLKEVHDGRYPIIYDDVCKAVSTEEDASRNGALDPWVNDNGINAFFNSLCTAANAKYAADKAAAGEEIEDAAIPRFVALNTTWYPTFNKKGYENGVKNWLKRAKCPGKKLLKVKKLFIPIHTGVHWVLLVVEGDKKRVRVYDSSYNATTGKRFLKTAFDYLREEIGEAFLEATEDNGGWRFENGGSGRQKNGSDCGVWTCFNAWSSLYGKPQDLMPELDHLHDARKTMAAILMKGAFKDEFALDQWYPGLNLEG